MGPQRSLLSATSPSHTAIPYYAAPRQAVPQSTSLGKKWRPQASQKWGKIELLYVICKEKRTPWSLTPLSSRYSGSGFALSNQINPEPPQSTGIFFERSWCRCPHVRDTMPANRALLPAPLLPTIHPASYHFAWPFPGTSVARGEIQPCAKGAAQGPCATWFPLNPHVQKWHYVSQIALCPGLWHPVILFFLSHPT